MLYKRKFGLPSIQAVQIYRCRFLFWISVTSKHLYIFHFYGVELSIWTDPKLCKRIVQMDNISWNLNERHSDSLILRLLVLILDSPKLPFVEQKLGRQNLTYIWTSVQSGSQKLQLSAVILDCPKLQLWVVTLDHIQLRLLAVILNCPNLQLWAVILDHPKLRLSAIIFNHPRFIDVNHIFLVSKIIVWDVFPFVSKNTVVGHNLGPSKITVVRRYFELSKMTFLWHYFWPSKNTVVGQNCWPSVVGHNCGLSKLGLWVVIFDCPKLWLWDIFIYRKKIGF